jgi:hypothetical protein
MAQYTKDDFVKLINETNYSTTKWGLCGRFCYKITANVCETIGHILIGVAAVIAFAAGSFNLSYLSFLSGATSVISVSLLKFASFAMAESKEQTDTVNKILTSLNNESVVDISAPPIADRIDGTTPKTNQLHEINETIITI